MDASIVLWEQWHDQVKQFFEGMHGHQKRGFALTVIGILLAGSAVVQRMAESVHLASISEAKMPSLERRFARFVANERLVVKNVWKQFLAQVLPYWHGKRIHLILDCTPCGEKAIIVYLGFLAHSRALPLAWRVMPLQESWDEKQWKLVGAMFDEVQAQLVSADCTLIADRGLSGAPLVKLCRDRQWHYLLRICKEHTVRRKRGQHFCVWMACGVVVHRTGQQWFGRVLCWQQETIDTKLSCGVECRPARGLVPDF